jgi:hypothetical protein
VHDLGQEGEHTAHGRSSQPAGVSVAVLVTPPNRHYSGQVPTVVGVPSSYLASHRMTVSR